MPATKIVVNIPGEAPYDVRIGEGLLQGVGEYCLRIPSIASAPQLLVITDSNVGPLYLPTVKASLEGAGFKVSDISVPAGESSKSVEVIAEIWEAMASLGLTRDCAVVALGGGVIGDLAAFAASTFMRGIHAVQIPTTLLSMVDSSVGGKTGINLDAGKNLVGTFMQPSYVCASIDTLSTLDGREWRCGCAEVAKSAVIDSNDFFFWMLEHTSDMSERAPDIVAEAIRRSVVFKADVVAQDKTESKGVRECLNYGHTLAHAIEVLSGYGKYSHGAAVAEGMRFAAFLGMRTVGTDSDFAEAQGTLLDGLGLERLDWRAEPADILAAMKRDKKARGGDVRFVLVRDVAEWSVTALDDGVILEALSDFYGWR